MSRFSDFDDFLHKQERHAGETIKRLQQSRDEHDLLLRELLRVFQEYYDEIIQPRRDLFVIAKKAESLPQHTEKRTGITPYYLYRINLVPKDTLPLSLTPFTVTNSDFLRPGVITTDDWHPYVALQFDVALHDSLTEEKLSPIVKIRLWNEPAIETQALLEHPITMSLEKSALTKTTVITIPYEEANPHALVDRTTRVLMMLTPHVLTHGE